MQMRTNFIEQGESMFVMKPEYSCIIAEDHPRCRNTLIQYATKLGLRVVDTPGSGNALIDAVFKFMPDLIITDILLDRMDGITACKHIQRQGFAPPVIIVSRSTEPRHYSACFELNSIDYINLPIPYDRFAKAVAKAKHRIEQHKTLSLLQQDAQNYIQVKHKYRTVNVAEKSIVFVEKVDKRRFEIHLTDGTIMETSTNLERIQDRCSEWIMTPHRSYLANIKHIETVIPDPIIQGNYLIVYPHINQNIPLTRRNYDHFLRLVHKLKISEAF